MKIEVPKDWFEKRLSTDEGEVGAGTPPKYTKYNQGRELRFRVWYPNEKKFYYTKVEDTYFHLGKDAWCEPYTIQPSSGCNDKNNKEIYEGDIISYSYNDGKSPTIGIVQFFAGMYLVQWIDQTDQELAYMRIDSMEVIGNMFQTPELLK
jgi:hypothetical protein